MAQSNPVPAEGGDPHILNLPEHATGLGQGVAVEGYGKLEKLADSLQHIVPGHDPLVMQRYPAVSKALEGIAVQLDADPTY